MGIPQCAEFPRQMLLGIVLAVTLTGCAAVRSAAPTSPPPDQPSPTAQATPAQPALTEAEAVDLVRQLPEIGKYRKAVEAAGRKLAWRVRESPSWFVIQMGESSPEKFTTSWWYVVNKKNREVQEWNIAKGSPPSD